MGTHAAAIANLVTMSPQHKKHVSSIGSFHVRPKHRLPAPVITRVSPFNAGFATPGQSTLAGFDFARLNASPTALIALAECSTSSWASVTSVMCAGRHGAALMGTAGMTVAGVTGTSSCLFSFDGFAGVHVNSTPVILHDGTGVWRVVCLNASVDFPYMAGMMCRRLTCFSSKDLPRETVKLHDTGH